jgi:transposase-like protein
MTEDRMALTELLQKSGDGDFLRSVAEAVLQILMEADVEGLIGAGRHERTGDRLNYRNGYRDRSLDTRLGSLQLRNSTDEIDKLFRRELLSWSGTGDRVAKSRAGGCKPGHAAFSVVPHLRHPCAAFHAAAAIG